MSRLDLVEGKGVGRRLVPVRLAVHGVEVKAEIFGFGLPGETFGERDTLHRFSTFGSAAGCGKLHPVSQVCTAAERGG